MTESKQDQWAQWLLHRRHGGDAEKQKALLKALLPIRDKVLQNAKLAPGETLISADLRRWPAMCGGRLGEDKPSPLLC